MSDEPRTPQRRASKKQPITVTHAATASLFHPTKNNPASADSFTAGRSDPVWWRGECGHEWQRTVNDQVKKEVLNKQPCPYCSGRAVLQGFNDLNTTHPDLAAEWHPDNLKASTEVRAGSAYKPVWVCSEGHTYQSAVYSRTVSKSGCPYCAGRKPVSGVNDLQTMNPDLAAEWHPTLNSRTPSDFLPHSNRKAWWRCGKGHEWEASINNRSDGRGCPECWKESKRK